MTRTRLTAMCAVAVRPMSFKVRLFLSTAASLASLAFAGFVGEPAALAATRHRASTKAGPSYPMKADEYRALMEKRIDAVRAVIDKKLDRRGVSQDRKKAIHKMIDEASQELRAEVAKATRDGTVTQAEADKVKPLATGLRAKVRERMRAEKTLSARGAKGAEGAKGKDGKDGKLAADEKPGSKGHATAASEHADAKLAGKAGGAAKGGAKAGAAAEANGKGGAQVAKSVAKAESGAAHTGGAKAGKTKDTKRSSGPTKRADASDVSMEKSAKSGRSDRRGKPDKPGARDRADAKKPPKSSQEADL